jgi:hypothetical protein
MSELSGLTVSELMRKLGEAGLSKVGRKAVLLRRLQEHIDKAAETEFFSPSSQDDSLSSNENVRACGSGSTNADKEPQEDGHAVDKNLNAFLLGIGLSGLHDLFQIEKTTMAVLLE